ncbi:MAG TPA: hypothetical protein PKE69_01140 [Pyrinomonadaceae bacterium]|nr:hypothetical protein [Pyrinomonadaceae bacterium]
MATIFMPVSEFLWTLARKLETKSAPIIPQIAKIIPQNYFWSPENGLIIPQNRSRTPENAS